MKKLLLTFLLFALVGFQLQAQVVINEVQADPGNHDGNGGEWIELRNVGATPVDLSCWILTNGGSYKLRIPSGLILQPGAYLLIGDASKMSCATCDFPQLHTQFTLNADGYGPGSGAYSNTMYLNTDQVLNGGCGCMDGNGVLNNGLGSGDRIILLDASAAIQDALMYSNGDYYNNGNAVTLNFLGLGTCALTANVQLPAVSDAIYTGKTICNDVLSCNTSFARFPDGNQTNPVTYSQNGNLVCTSCLLNCPIGAVNTAAADHPTPGLSNNSSTQTFTLNGLPLSGSSSTITICGAQAQSFQYNVFNHQNVALGSTQSNGNLGSYVLPGNTTPVNYSSATFNSATGTTQLIHNFIPPSGSTTYSFVWADEVTQCAICPGSANLNTPGDPTDDNKECFEMYTLTVQREDPMTGVATVTCALPGFIEVNGMNGSNLSYTVQKQITSGGPFTTIYGPQSSNLFGGIIDDDADPNLPNYQVIISSNNTVCVNNSVTVSVPISCLGNPECPIYATSGTGVPTFTPSPGLYCAGSPVTFNVEVKGVCTGGQVEVLYSHSSGFDPYTQGTSLGTVNTTVGATPPVTTASGRVYISEFVPRPSNVAPCVVDGTNPNSGEYVELYNAGPGNVDVSGWVLTDGDWTATIPQGVVINANSFYLIGGGGTVCFSGIVPDLNIETCNCTGGTNTAGTDFMNLTNTTEWLGLYDCSNNFVDGLYWGTIGTQSTTPPVSLVGGCGNYLTAKTPVYPGITATVPSATQLENTGGSFSGTTGGRARDASGLWTIAISNNQVSTGSFNGTPKAVNGAFSMWNGIGTPFGSQCPPPPVNASITVNLPDTCTNTSPTVVTLKAIYRPDPVTPCTKSAVTAQANYIIPPCAVLNITGSAEYCAPAIAPLSITTTDPLSGNHDVTISNGINTVTLSSISGSGPFNTNVTQSGAWTITNVTAPLGTCPPKGTGAAQIDIYQTPVISATPAQVSSCYSYGFDLATVEGQLTTNPQANSFFWYDQAVGGSPISAFVNPSASTTYYVAPSAGINISCEGARVPITLDLDPLPIAPNVLCNGTQVTFVPQSPDCFPLPCSGGLQYSVNGSTWSNGPTFSASDPGWAGWGYPTGTVYIRNAATPACYTPVFYILPCSAPLPAYILHFTGTLNERGETQINWTAVNEEHVKTYWIERSTDGIQYEPIGQVDATLVSSPEKPYAFIDKDVPGGKVFYRLRVEDLNGQIVWSHSIFVLKQVKETQVSVSPNPGNSDCVLTILVDAKQNMTFTAYDLMGRPVLKLTELIAPGQNQFNLPTAHLPASTYYFKVVMGAEHHILKWIKE